MAIAESAGELRAAMSFPSIEPVSPRASRPLISVMITVYDRLDHLERALRSVLEQALPPEEMQIEVIQDGGAACEMQEAVRELVRRTADGRVAMHCHPVNLGHPEIFNLALARALGRWVHILHDDDALRPGFYAAIRRGIEQFPDLAMAFCRFEERSADGALAWRSELERADPGLVPDWLDRITESCRLQFCAVVLRRSVVEQVGGFSPAARSAFDWELWQRIAAANAAAWFDPDVLATMHHGGDNETTTLRATGQQARDSFRAIEVAQAYLPAAIREQAAMRARRFYTAYAARLAERFARLGLLPAALANLRAALEHAPTPQHRGELADLLDRIGTAIDPGSGAAAADEHFRLAMLWLMVHDGTRAIDCLRRAVELAPYDIAANRKLAELLSRRGDIAGAREHMARAISMLPDPGGRLGTLQQYFVHDSPRLKVLDARCEASLPQPVDQPGGRLDLGRVEVFHGHRSGLRYGLEALAPLHHSAGVRLEPALERTLVALRSGAIDGLPFAGDWVGFVHNPYGMPDWFHSDEAPQRLLRGREWDAARETCGGLFTFSKHLAEWLAGWVDVPVSPLVLPTVVPSLLFDPARFDANPNKQVIQVGWWLRQQNAIDRLPLPEGNPFGYGKLRLVPHFFDHAEAYLAVLRHIERRTLGLEIAPGFARNTFERFHASNDEYDVLLSENIVFVHLYDASANNTVAECLARCTPLLVNRLPAVEEYLGGEYPLFYETLDEAAALALDRGAITAAHEHLRGSPVRERLSAEAFRRDVESSAVYLGLPETG